MMIYIHEVRLMLCGESIDDNVRGHTWTAPTESSVDVLIYAGGTKYIACMTNC